MSFHDFTLQKWNGRIFWLPDGGADEICCRLHTGKNFLLLFDNVMFVCTLNCCAVHIVFQLVCNGAELNTSAIGSFVEHWWQRRPLFHMVVCWKFSSLSNINKLYSLLYWPIVFAGLDLQSKFPQLRMTRPPKIFMAQCASRRVVRMRHGNRKKRKITVTENNYAVETQYVVRLAYVLCSLLTQLIVRVFTSIGSRVVVVRARERLFLVFAHISPQCCIERYCARTDRCSSDTLVEQRRPVSYFRT